MLLLRLEVKRKGMSYQINTCTSTSHDTERSKRLRSELYVEATQTYIECNVLLYQERITCTAIALFKLYLFGLDDSVLKQILSELISRFKISSKYSSKIETKDQARYQGHNQYVQVQCNALAHDIRDSNHVRISIGW